MLTPLTTKAFPQGKSLNDQIIWEPELTVAKAAYVASAHARQFCKNVAARRTDGQSVEFPVGEISILHYFDSPTCCRPLIGDWRHRP